MDKKLTLQSILFEAGHGSVAKSVRVKKEKYPENYCTNPDCLFRVKNFGHPDTPCPKHMKPSGEASKAVAAPSMTTESGGGESPADQAHALNLVSKGWGNWADKSGQTVAKTIDGNLVKIDPTEAGNIQSDEEKTQGSPSNIPEENGHSARMDALSNLAAGHTFPPGAKSYDSAEPTETAKTAQKLMAIGEYELNPQEQKLFDLLADRMVEDPESDHLSDKEFKKGLLSLALSVKMSKNDNADSMSDANGERLGMQDDDDDSESDANGERLGMQDDDERYEAGREDDGKHFGPDESVSLRLEMKRFRIK